MITATEARRRGLLVVDVGACGYFCGRGLLRISRRRGRRGAVRSVGGPASFSVDMEGYKDASTNRYICR